MPTCGKARKVSRSISRLQTASSSAVGLASNHLWTCVETLSSFPSRKRKLQRSKTRTRAETSTSHSTVHFLRPSVLRTRRWRKRPETGRPLRLSARSGSAPLRILSALLRRRGLPGQVGQHLRLAQIGVVENVDVSSIGLAPLVEKLGLTNLPEALAARLSSAKKAFTSASNKPRSQRPPCAAPGPDFPPWSWSF